MIHFLIAFVVGGALYRWRGHSSKYKKYFPRPFNQIAFALPYAVFSVHPYTDGFFQIGMFVLILMLTSMATLSGHGRGLGLDEPMNELAEPETFEPPILWLEHRIPTYWYKVCVMAVTGAAVTIPAGVATLNPLLAASGLLKAPAYMLGTALSKRYKNELGEFFTGAFLWGSLAVIAKLTFMP